jgi:hypothetical protein
MEPNFAGMMIWKRILLSTNEVDHSWGEDNMVSKGRLSFLLKHQQCCFREHLCDI